MELARRPRDPLLAALPSLAFGDSRAVIGRSIKELSESIRRVVPSLQSYDARNAADFCYRSAFARVNSLVLAALAAPATGLRVGSQPQAAMIFTHSGECAVRVEQSLYKVRAGDSAVLLPPDCPNVMDASKRSAVVIQIDWVRLKNTSSAMLGADLRESTIPLHPSPQQLALTQDRVSFDAVFRSLFAQIDLYADHLEMLDVSGIDDAFYRNLSIAIDPQAFIRQAEVRKMPVDRRRLGRVCEYVMANLGSPITLTDLERIGHMSRRTLHNHFCRTFGLSPSEWVRGQRLMKAQSLLSNPRNFQSVTEVLYACGFTHASLFSTQYKHRFGETPSETLQQSQSRR